VNVLNQAPDGTTLYDKRPYISECITCFSDSELPPYYIRVVDGEAQHMAIEMESAGFRGKTTQIKPFPDTFNPHTYLGWGISRKSVALGLIALAREIDDLHGQGLVHGDLRPANILSGKNGLVAIDHLNIECGQPSGAVAPGWAAPEQLLGQAVGPQSDVFSLGIIAAQLCGAVVFGEMRNFVFPVGGKERKTVSLFHHPRVFIDSNEKFSVESCKAWSGFIESCLQFDPADRIQSADAFAVKMQETLDTYGLPLTLEMSSLGPGRHQKCRTTNGATTSVCYILSQMHIIPFSPRRLT
jgi:serine/threonine protein kinase